MFSKYTKNPQKYFGDKVTIWLLYIKLLEKKLSNEWNAEIDYAFSDEYIEEMIYCNSYEFLEDGIPHYQMELYL